MDDHPKHVRGAQEAYSQYSTPLVHENDANGGTSNSREKSGAGNPPAPSSKDNDEAQLNSDLLTAWTQRLQILTVVTTFLASTDGMLFSLTALNTQIGLPTGTTARELVYSCLAGALIFHICSCILGYVASFALIRYRIIDAVAEDDTKVESIQFPRSMPAQRLPRRIVLEPVRPLRACASLLQLSDGLRFLSGSSSSPPSPPPPPLTLVTHCYYTTLCLTTAGFILALTGILAYIWAGLPVAVGIFSTICLGICISATVWALAM